MKLELATELLEAAERLDIRATLHGNYSGRGMYGETTAAISLKDWSEFTRLCVEVAYESAAGGDYDDQVGLHDFLTQARWDTFEHDIILY